MLAQRACIFRPPRPNIVPSISDFIFCAPFLHPESFCHQSFCHQSFCPSGIEFHAAQRASWLPNLLASLQILPLCVSASLRFNSPRAPTRTPRPGSSSVLLSSTLRQYSRRPYSFSRHQLRPPTIAKTISSRKKRLRKPLLNSPSIEQYSFHFVPRRCTLSPRFPQRDRILTRQNPPLLSPFSDFPNVRTKVPLGIFPHQTASVKLNCKDKTPPPIHFAQTTQKRSQPRTSPVTPLFFIVPSWIPNLLVSL